MTMKIAEGLRASWVPADDSTLSLSTLLDRVIELRGDAKFFHMDTPLAYPGLPTSLNAIEIRAFVNRVGNTLLANGLHRGDRVAIFKTDAPDYCFIALGIIKAGGIAVPIHSNMGFKDLDYYLKYTGSSFLVTDRATFDAKIKSADALPQVGTWIFPEAPDAFTARHIDLSKELARASDELAPRELAPDTIAYLFHTSGTTDFPKAVISTCDRHVISMKGLSGKPFPVTGELPGVPYHQITGRIGLGYPFHHLGSHLILNTTMLGCMDIYTHTKGADPEAALGLIQREKLTFFLAFPDAFHTMYEAGLDRFDLSSIRTWVSLSDTMHEIHMKAFAEAGTTAVFCDLLAASELGAVALTRWFTASTPLSGRRDMGMGNPKGLVTKIADEHGRELPAGQVGRLMAHGPTLFRGYWDSHDKFVRAIVDGWFWTGDVAYRDAEGRTYQLDRESDVIRTRKGPAYTLIIEENLMNHPDVGDAAVCGVPHPEDDEVPIAVVYARQGRSADADSIQTWVNSRVDATSALRKVFVVEPQMIPRGVTGKVLKRVLREKYASMFNGK